MSLPETPMAPRPAPGDLMVTETLRRIGTVSPELLEAILGHAQAKRAVQAMRQVQAPLVAKFERRMAVLLRELGERVGDAAQHYGLNEASRAAAAPDDHHAQVNRTMDAANVNEWQSARLTPAFVTHYNEVFAITIRALMRAGLAPGEREAVAHSLLEQGGRRVGLLDIPAATRESIFRALEEGLKKGFNPIKTARLIREMVPEGRFVNAGSAYRAELIARSETAHAQRISSLLHYHSNGNVQHVLAFDGIGDPECAQRNGQLFTLAQAEVESYETHPNCVLSFGPVAR